MTNSVEKTKKGSNLKLPNSVNFKQSEVTDLEEKMSILLAITVVPAERSRRKLTTYMITCIEGIVPAQMSSNSSIAR